MAKHSFTHVMLDGIDVTQNHTSNLTSVESIDQFLILVSWSGNAPKGEIVLEMTNASKLERQKAVGTVLWTPVDFGGITNIPVDSGNSGEHQINFTQAPFAALRMRFIPDGSAPGTGTLTAQMAAKSIGA